MAYANIDDLLAYTVNLDPPAEASRLLERASDVIDEATLGRIDLENPEHVVAARKAVCAQVEFWISNGETEDQTGQRVKSYRVGSLSIEYEQTATSGSSDGQLAPRARRHLLLAGLLYRGVATS